LIFGTPGVGLVWAMPRIKKLCEQYDIKGLEVIAVVTENKERVAKIVATQKFPYSRLFGDKK
jgi:hypothetical protein